ncbi:lasso peptide biosynthesis B2 protein [Kribbella sp. CA-294648]|uniref:lasso peptide biosynthesis B2 protein n=1 Tax=Kribbella sp. CA-294648 TaxID=3239948 RepID=UPI003D8F70C4
MVTVRMTMQAGQDQAHAPLTYRLAAVPALLIASVLARWLPLRATLAIVRTTKRATGRHPLSRDGAQVVLRARDWAAARFPGRSACMEASLAAVLLAACTGHGVDWCIGCRFNPAQSHAWIEVDYQPVGEPQTPDRPFHVTIRI